MLLVAIMDGVALLFLSAAPWRIIMCCFPFFGQYKPRSLSTIVFAIINEMMLTSAWKAILKARNALFIELTTVPERGRQFNDRIGGGALGGAVIV